MLFNSFEFLIFLPIVFILYWLGHDRRWWQNAVVVLSSYVFYGWWDWRFLLLIAFTTICSYASGIMIEHYHENRKAQRAVSAVNIIVCISILGLFKYYNFFVDSADELFYALFGRHLDWCTIKVILPDGISFYTFQALSYTIDVYRRSIKATHDALEFFAYICFFPQLVAGPIERATRLLPQFQVQRHFNYDKAVDGMRQMLWGFLKKLVIADNCAAIVNAHWHEYETLPGLSLCMLAVLFSLQIYCDFSGYSDIAIGSARLFGIDLIRNFNYPYFSRNIAEFWRRWHISLMTWFRDYIYIPMGGSHCSRGKTLRNIFVVWSVSGLWHGANWTFVCWGLYHGLLLSVYQLLRINTKRKELTDKGCHLPSIKETLAIAFTFTLAVAGWIFFRSESITQAIGYFSAIAHNPFYTAGDFFWARPMLFCLALLGVEWLQQDKQHALVFSRSTLFRFRAARWAVYFVIIMLISIYSGASQEFIYFQF